MATAGDRRDQRRRLVDLAVDTFGAEHRWTTRQVRKAKRLAYRTIWTECDWNNWGNPGVCGSCEAADSDGVPPTGGDLDSVGLYQQRAKWWGTTAGSMCPYTSTWRFLDVMLRDAAGWLDLDEAVVCQMVQRSQFDGRTIDKATGRPLVFAANYRERQPATDALEMDPLFFEHQEEAQ